ncbi:hypothetical protein EST38_g4393 [Candolleomyces aberdarensis]|uniref:Protein kinase domain-containing protein n=1 Tax=Candolleomyces aberdarensis TaxID=2316362 RepID=A0A4Q2DQI8_9AGAR|nr:hypothetical protein EST38_g4393 [Candolleomyces aberdarensis]
MRILSPVLDAFVQTLPKVLGIDLEEQNVLHKAQETNGSSTIADFSTWKSVPVPTTWNQTHPALSFAELKPPKAACSNGMQGGLEALYNNRLVIQPNESVPSNVKSIGQIVELCHQSSLGFGWLAACPLDLRPIYLHLDTGQAFLADNIMGGPVAEKHIFEQDRWAHFFRKVFWITFCVWLKGLDEAIEVLKVLDLWKEWGPIVERTLRPGEHDLAVRHAARLIPFSSAAATLRRLVHATSLFLTSTSFKVLGPQTVFNLMSKFTFSPISCASVLTYPKRCMRFIHAYLPPDCVLYRDYAVVCIYRKWGFVVKFALEESGFEAELQALQHLAPLECFPSIIAHGSTSASLSPVSIPFVVITYHGEALHEIDPYIASIIYHDILQPMHSKGYHHHDIRAENITKDSKGRHHLIDFNLAVPAAQCEGDCPDLAFLEDWGLGSI